MNEGFDALGDVLKPSGHTTNSGVPVTHTGNVLGSATGNAQNATIQQQSTTAAAASGKVLTGDLESSLASLAENLTINKSASAQVK